MFAFLVPNSGMQRHEYCPPCKLATQEQHSNKGKHSLPFPVLSTRQISAFRTDNSAPFIMLFGTIYICYVGQAIRAKAQSRAFGTEGLTLTPRASQGVLCWTKPVDWSSLSSRRAVLEHFFALVPCVRKSAHELQGCSARSTKTQRAGMVSLKLCFRPQLKFNVYVSVTN